MKDEAGAGDITDADLVVRASSGDRAAFGMLYLRHHLAAWRLAAVVSGFNDDAEVAVIDGFTNVFSAVPASPDSNAFRRHLLVCVRRIALDRVLPRAAGGAGSLDGDSGTDVALIREALRALPELSRTMLWLCEVEGWSPAEVALAFGLDPTAVEATLADSVEVLQHRGRRTTRRRRPLGPPRLEVGPGLAVAVPPVPALGGECQRRWLRERAMHAAVADSSLRTLTGSGWGA